MKLPQGCQQTTQFQQPSVPGPKDSDGFIRGSDWPYFGQNFTPCFLGYMSKKKEGEDWDLGSHKHSSLKEGMMSNKHKRW